MSQVGSSDALQRPLDGTDGHRRQNPGPKDHVQEVGDQMCSQRSHRCRLDALEFDWGLRTMQGNTVKKLLLCCSLLAYSVIGQARFVTEMTLSEKSMRQKSYSSV